MSERASTPGPESSEPAPATSALSGGGDGHTNGDTDEHMRQAVGAARRAADERATAEILALEEDLERERAKANAALEEVQKRLEEAEAKATEAAAGSDLDAREEAADWLREQRQALRRETEAEVRRELGDRELELIGERDRREESERRLREHTELLQQQIDALESEAEARIEDAVAEARGETEEEVRAEI